MRKRLTGSLRMGLAGAVLALTMPAAAWGDDGTVLLHGHVVAPPGASAAAASTGQAALFIDDSDESTRWPAKGIFRSIATDRLSDSRFRLAARASRALTRAARANDGWVNMLALVRTPAGHALYPFTRELGRDGATSASAKNVRLELTSYAEGTGPAPTALASQQQRAECEWVTSRPYYRYTRVGQLHQWDGFRSTFHYATGSQADSSIDVAIGQDDGPLKVRGSYHVSKTTTGERGSIMPAGKARFARYMWTRFSYYLLYTKGKDCTIHTRVLRPRRHEGGSYYKRHDDVARVLDGACHTVTDGHALNVVPHGTEWTLGGTAKKVNKSLTIFGVTLGSQSGWSEHVKSEWYNAGNAHRAICSVYETPNYAPITYVGGITRR